MTAPTALGLRCERPYCPEQATHIASRVDAIRDWTYLCPQHSGFAPEEKGWRGVWETSPLPERASEEMSVVLTLELTLAYWKPKHRGVTRKDAQAIVDAWYGPEGPR